MTKPVPGPIPNSYTVPGTRLTAGEYPGARDPAEVSRLFQQMTPEKLEKHADGSPETDEQRDMVRGWRDNEERAR